MEKGAALTTVVFLEGQRAWLQFNRHTSSTNINLDLFLFNVSLVNSSCIWTLKGVTVTIAPFINPDIEHSNVQTPPRVFHGTLTCTVWTLHLWGLCDVKVGAGRRLRDPKASVMFHTPRLTGQFSLTPPQEVWAIIFTCTLVLDWAKDVKERGWKRY